MPDQVHAVAFTVQNTASTRVLAAASDEAAICKGDTVGATPSTASGLTVIVGANSL